MSEKEWQRIVILANFPLFLIREEPNTKRLKENSLTEKLDENLDQYLLNLEQKQASQRKY